MLDIHGVKFKYKPTVNRYGDIYERAYMAKYKGYLIDIHDHGSDGGEWGFTVEYSKHPYDFSYDTEENEGPYRDSLSDVVDIIKVTLDATE